MNKDEIRKKNYIGDSVIAERSELDENEGQLKVDDSNAKQASQANYMKKFSKISQLYEESTKEYK